MPRTTKALYCSSSNRLHHASIGILTIQWSLTFLLRSGLLSSACCAFKLCFSRQENYLLEELYLVLESLLMSGAKKMIQWPLRREPFVSAVRLLVLSGENVFLLSFVFCFGKNATGDIASYLVHALYTTTYVWLWTIGLDQKSLEALEVPGNHSALPICALTFEEEIGILSLCFFTETVSVFFFLHFGTCCIWESIAESIFQETLSWIHEKVLSVLTTQDVFTMTMNEIISCNILKWWLRQ